MKGNIYFILLAIFTTIDTCVSFGISNYHSPISTRAYILSRHNAFRKRTHHKNGIVGKYNNIFGRNATKPVATGVRRSISICSQIIFSCLFFFSQRACASELLPNVSVQSISPLLMRQTELRLVARLIIAAMSGSIVGWERGSTKHCAGVRTMALVSLGAAAFTICSAYGFGGRGDPSRMAANVASGVGFLGAGVITTDASGRDESGNKNNIVHGLTTAASIWLSAALGVVSGLGLHFLSFMTALITVGILRLGKHQETKQRKLDKFNSQIHQVTGHYSSDLLATNDCVEFDCETKNQATSVSTGEHNMDRQEQKGNTKGPATTTLSLRTVLDGETSKENSDMSNEVGIAIFGEETFIDDNADTFLGNFLTVQNSTTFESRHP